MTARKQSKSKSKTPRPATRAAPTREVEASAVEVQESVASPNASFPIVGVGASAGGLAAFEAFFSAMPADTEPGMHREPNPRESGTNNVLKMARVGLRSDLTTALHRVAGSGKAVRCPGLRVKTNGEIDSENSVHDLTVEPHRRYRDRAHLRLVGHHGTDGLGADGWNARGTSPSDIEEGERHDEAR